MRISVTSFLAGVAFTAALGVLTAPTARAAGEELRSLVQWAERGARALEQIAKNSERCGK